MTQNNNDTKLHIAMYPWLAMGHITSFLRIGNKLAERGHKITLFLPPKTQLRFASQNHHPKLITFVTVPLPPVDGFPSEAETTNDIPENSRHLLMTAMDLTQDTIEAHLVNLKPNIVFYDFTCWLPVLARKHGIKSVIYLSVLLVTVAHSFQFLHLLMPQSISNAQNTSPLPPFPSPYIKMHAYEKQSTDGFSSGNFGGGMSLVERFFKSLTECDAIGVKTCKEMEGIFCDYIENHGKRVLTAGPVRPDPQTDSLEERFAQWLAGFKPGEVVYCAFGSECILDKVQFQELVLGLELTGRPFLAALKPPTGYETIESALPDGFTERTEGRGIVYGGWVQQQLILQHPSVGCFITHCGAGSLSEAMVNKCQLVMIPNAVDQFINARMMSGELRVGVEVETREEDGFLSREAVCKAVATVMDDESQVGREVRANHTKWREFILQEGVEESYISSFIKDLQQLVHG
ncbi:UDP-glycosyltransferase 79B30-like [Silene latifolia]|uniref:UDP-glycosyltransferase 79B30-like n=1 Tax=Silene latifolia TaxID=37657 RepID=UPI003D7889F7